tara:strand:- start:2846 stop:3775 length:930 start_codon:yes stop_codon:yes gene_type:complete
MQRLGRFALVLLLSFNFPLIAQQADQSSNEQQEYQLWAENLWSSMSPQSGKIALADSIALLDVPDNFYFLNQEDSKKVLEDIWGNPPGSSEALLGMLFKQGTTPFDGDAWGVSIEYEQDGYVSDEDAEQLNYDKLLLEMKNDAQQNSRARVEQGYDPIELVGWAAKPYYDKTSNKLHWAKEFKFGDSATHTLNYNIRILGRKGVLVLNFIANIDQLAEIDHNIDTVLAMAEFNEGSRYSDFDPDLDDVAAYGIGALVAGKVIAKTGFLAAAFIFLKKFGIVILIALGALLKKLFWRKDSATNDNDTKPS